MNGTRKPLAFLLMLSLVVGLGAAPAFGRGAAVQAQDQQLTPTLEAAQPTVPTVGATQAPVESTQPPTNPGVPLSAQTATASPTAVQALTSTVAPGPTEMAPASFDQGLPTNQIIIKYKTGSIAKASPLQSDQMQRLDGTAGMPLTYLRAMSGDANVLRLPEKLPVQQVQAMADQLMTLPEVEYAEPDRILLPVLAPNDPFYSNQWDLFAPWGIDAPAAWDITTGSSTIVVADIDTGITNHAEFSGRTIPGYDFIGNDLIANDGQPGRDSNPSDPGDWVTQAESDTTGTVLSGCPVRNSSWHGTHTAGTIGASGNNSIGVSGINWNSKILPVRVLGKCGGFNSDVADGMRWAAGLPITDLSVPTDTHPARVLNLSLGGSSPICSLTFQNAIDAITSAGAVVVVAAGNANQNASAFEPANCNGVITVAATDSSGSKASYSNWGSTVEISAPGNNVLSTLNAGTQGPDADTYGLLSGTSMATPHVTGVVSLMLSVNPSLTPARALQLLQSSARPYPDGTCTNCGGGILEAAAAVRAATPATKAKFDFNGDGRADISIYRQSNATWYIYGVGNGVWGGVPGDIPVPGDYNADGMTDVGIYRPSNGTWFIQSVGNAVWGGFPGDVPVPGDYNGDGKTDVAIYRPSTATWYIHGVIDTVWGGGAGDIPVQGDYNADNVTDVGIYEPSTGTWLIQGVGNAVWGGVPGDIPVPADYTGDGKTDVAIYRPSTGTWYIQGVGDAVWGGVPGDIPVPADYNGDGTADIAIYRPSTGEWFISGVGTFVLGGDSGDYPLPAPDTNGNGTPY